MESKKVIYETLTTYRRDDGEPICGEYDFVTGLEWFEGDTESTRLVKETWIRIETDLITVNHDEEVES